MLSRLAPLLLVGTLLAGGCGDDGTAIEVAEDATFCSVFAGQYRQALDAAVPITDEGFSTATDELAAWAQVLVDLAPSEIEAEAQDNLQMHLAQAEVESAAEFIPGSNAMHAWANTNC